MVAASFHTYRHIKPVLVLVHIVDDLLQHPAEKTVVLANLVGSGVLAELQADVGSKIKNTARTVAIATFGPLGQKPTRRLPATLRAIAPIKLPHVKAMGFNLAWRLKSGLQLSVQSTIGQRRYFASARSAPERCRASLYRVPDCNSPYCRFRVCRCIGAYSWR